MTPADQATQEPEAPITIRRRQRGGRRIVAVSSSVSAMDALRARIRAQSKTVADHIAADPEAQAFIKDPALALPDLTVVLQPSPSNGCKKVSYLLPQSLTCVAKTRITAAELQQLRQLVVLTIGGLS